MSRQVFVACSFEFHAEAKYKFGLQDELVSRVSNGAKRGVANGRTRVD